MAGDLDQASAAVRRRYDRIARFYDPIEVLVERLLYRGWRQLAWRKVAGVDILEVGVGTGRNLLFHPADVNVTAIDISGQMLRRAKQKAAKLGSPSRLLQMDVQRLEFADESFDTVIGTFLFCSVPDPVLGLKEVARVCRACGKIVLLEHVLSPRSRTARIMNLLNPPISRLTAENINRPTVRNVSLAGLAVERVTNLRSGIFLLIEARKPRR